MPRWFGVDAALSEVEQPSFALFFCGNFAPAADSAGAMTDQVSTTLSMIASIYETRDRSQVRWRAGLTELFLPGLQALHKLAYTTQLQWCVLLTVCCVTVCVGGPRLQADPEDRRCWDDGCGAYIALRRAALPKAHACSWTGQDHLAQCSGELPQEGILRISCVLTVSLLRPIGVLRRAGKADVRSTARGGGRRLSRVRKVP